MTTFSNNSRPYAGVPSATYSEANRNGNSLTSTLGNGSIGVGKNIWGNLGENKVSRETEAKRFDGPPMQHDWGMRPVAAASNSKSASSLPPVAKQSQPQSRQASAATLQFGNSASTGVYSQTPGRPTTVRLQSKPQMNKGSTAYSPNPPALYTKLDRHMIGDSSFSLSPTDTRKHECDRSPYDTPMTSQPPSRGSNSGPDSSFSTWSDRLPLSSTCTNSYPNQHRSVSLDNDADNSLDQFLPRLGAFTLGQNSHAAYPRKRSDPSNGQTSRKSPLDVKTFTRFTPQSRQYYDQEDDVRELDRLDMNVSAFDSFYNASDGALPRFAAASQFGPLPSQFDVRPSQSSTAGNISPHTYDFGQDVRQQKEWSSISNGAVAKQSPGFADPLSLLDPQLQHMMALRTPHTAPLYSPYSMSGGIQFGAVSPYFQMFPMGLPGLENALVARADMPAADGVQSAKLYEFKMAGKNNKRYELKDIFDHIAEFAGDQHGSRFIQTKLETANSDEKERVFREIEPNAIPLMKDVFGNYVIQKFFDHGHQDHKRLLANKMRGQVLYLSNQAYGCRVVQKALEHVLVEQQAALVGELEHHVLQCVKDQNGNHVIQKAIERCPSDTIAFIYQAFLGQVQHLSLHPYGCRVIQRCLERQDWYPAKNLIMKELHDSMQQGMIADSYGNYVVQHVVEKGGPMDKKHVFNIVIQRLESYSKHKFASNVVEKCIEHSDDQWRRDLVNALVSNDQRRGDGDGVLAGLVKDNFGNYVIQKLLEKLCPADFMYFHQHLQPAISHAKRTGCGKQLVSIEKKMQERFLYLPQRQSHPMMLGITQTPFTSTYGSVANTPPPLTADTQSLQSSGIPSINGDTVEGAHSMSRKGSDMAHDGRMLR